MPSNRHTSVPVKVAGVTIGGQAPIVVQSMTNTDTADVEATARQVQQLAAAGSELVRITVNTAEVLAKYRINPGNVGRGSKRDPQFAEMIEIACRNGKPVRIGVNWGSLDQDLLLRLMDENSLAAEPKSAQEVMREAIIRSALQSAQRAVELGMPPERIV